MGVSGCGKTTLASSIATHLPAVYIEGDDHHPPSNKEKMGNGIPLTDEDRWPWFDRLTAAAREAVASGQPAVLSCSALKKVYRDYLFRGFESHRLIHMDGDYDTIWERMAARNHEYMKPNMLRSQFETLEKPLDEEIHLPIPVADSPEVQLQTVLDWLRNS